MPIFDRENVVRNGALDGGGPKCPYVCVCECVCLNCSLSD